MPQRTTGPVSKNEGELTEAEELLFIELTVSSYEDLTQHKDIDKIMQ